MWGLYDTIDGVWMGDDNGPLLYGDRIEAQLASQMVDAMCGRDPGRTRPVLYAEARVRLLDKLEAVLTAEDALASLENGVS